MTGGKRKVRRTRRLPLCSNKTAVAWWHIPDWRDRLLCVKNGISLTCLAADEPEPYCIEDGEKEWWKSPGRGGACLNMMLKQRCGILHGGCVHLLQRGCGYYIVKMHEPISAEFTTNCTQIIDEKDRPFCDAQAILFVVPFL